MEMHQLRYFHAVARAGSFTKAAEAERVSQPTLSQQIRKLEQDLGVALFERRGRSVGLTAAGRALLPQAQAVLRQLADARQTVECVREEIAGPLTVGCIPTITPFFIAPRIADFEQRYPNVHLTLREDVTAHLVAELFEGALDIAVLGLPLKAQDLIVSELVRERLMVALPPQHPLASLPELDGNDLKNERVLVLREGHCFRDSAMAACRRARLDLSAAFESDQFASIFALVEAGFGVSIAPEMAAPAAGRCRLVPLRGGAVRRIGYAQRRRAFVPPAQKAFVSWLRSSGAQRRSAANA